MPNGGFSGRNLQGIVRVLQAFGNTGCYSYINTENYSVKVNFDFFQESREQNTVCVYDDFIYYTPSNFTNSYNEYGSLYVNRLQIGDSFGSGYFNIGATYEPPFNEPPLFNPLGNDADEYALARHIVADTSGFYVFSFQTTSTHRYVQFSSFELDWTPKTNTGQTTYDASGSDGERYPESMAAYNGDLYTISNDGTIYVYDFGTLTSNASWTVTDGSSASNHSISVWDDKVYVMQTKSSTPKHCKVYVYDLTGAVVDDFDITAYFITTPGHFAMIVDSGVIYTTISSSQSKYTTDGTVICHSQITYQNNLAGYIMWKYGGNLYLDNGKVISP